MRVGIAVYGFSPAPDVVSTEQLGLVPAMTVRGTVVLTKEIAAGTGVSYGHTFVAEEPMRVALVPMGYGDGIPRHASNPAEVLVNGVRGRVLGRVCMDQFVVAAPETHAGDEVVVFGPGSHGEPTATDWARWCGTIDYEIVTRMGGRQTRVWVGEEARGSEGRACEAQDVCWQGGGGSRGGPRRLTTTPPGASSDAQRAPSRLVIQEHSSLAGLRRRRSRRGRAGRRRDGRRGRAPRGEGRAPGPRADRLGVLHSDPVDVTCDDGVVLHAEIDEVAPYADSKTARRRKPRNDVTLVFAHGYALNLDCWHFQREAFRGKHRMAFYDQRSHGRSQRSDREHATIDQLGDDLARVIETVAPKGKVVLIGHSMGGMSIVAFAERHPEVFAKRVSGVALVATTAGGLRAAPHGEQVDPGQGR